MASSDVGRTLLDEKYAYAEKITKLQEARPPYVYALMW